MYAIAEKAIFTWLALNALSVGFIFLRALAFQRSVPPRLIAPNEGVAVRPHAPLDRRGSLSAKESI